MIKTEEAIKALELCRNTRTVVPKNEVLDYTIQALEEIQQYRAIGTVEEFKAYEDLEEQGLLFRLPCKVGDIVYYEHPYSSVHTGIQAYQITNIMISQNKKGAWTKKYRAMMLLNGKIIDSQINFSFDDIGKTVFLTKAEAEAALDRMKGE